MSEALGPVGRTLLVSAALVVAHALVARALVLWDPGAALVAGPAKATGAVLALGAFYLLRAFVLFVLPPIVGVACVRAVRRGAAPSEL